MSPRRACYEAGEERGSVSGGILPFLARGRALTPAFLGPDAEDDGDAPALDYPPPFPVYARPWRRRRPFLSFLQTSLLTHSGRWSTTGAIIRYYTIAEIQAMTARLLDGGRRVEYELRIRSPPHEISWMEPRSPRLHRHVIVGRIRFVMPARSTGA
ncbi:hypothetical protein DFH09DRAFT_612917 [Mycena vulgaris]|nr:hypothetical protein DFH09DRAFT_612917 [Mycena vulgaris]